LPWYEKDESYKYLGVWINLNLDWSHQTQVFKLYLLCINIWHYLRKRCFTASQAAEILNLVVFPSITYRMSVVKYSN